MSIPNHHVAGLVIEDKQLCVYCDFVIYDASAPLSCYLCEGNANGACNSTNLSHLNVRLPAGGWPTGARVSIPGSGNQRCLSEHSASGWECRVWGLMPWSGPLSEERRALVEQVLAMSVTEFRAYRRRLEDARKTKAADQPQE